MENSQYVTLGRTGLRVSPLCLGVMSFGTDWGWGTAEGASAAILDRYLESGGNFVDTADMYTNGHSRQTLVPMFAAMRIYRRGLEGGIKGGQLLCLASDASPDRAPCIFRRRYHFSAPARTPSDIPRALSFARLPFRASRRD